MRIGLFTDTYFPQVSGVATSIRTLKTELEKLGHTVFIFTTTDKDVNRYEDWQIIRIPSVPFFAFKDRRIAYRGFSTALEIARQYQLDIIHTQTEFSLGLLGVWIAKELRIPVVHTYHTQYEDYVHYIAKGMVIRPSMVKYIVRGFMSDLDGVICPSEIVYDLLMKYKVKVEKRVIPTGIELAKFERPEITSENIADLRGKLGISNQETMLLSLSRVSYEKNIQAVLAALPAVLEENPDVKLVVAGDGPYLSDLKAQAKRLGITYAVVFTGMIAPSETALYYKAADFFISASTSETQGLTYLESLASGTPIIAHGNPYLDNVINDKMFGTLYYEERDLAGAILEAVIATPDLDEKSLATKLYEISAENFGRRVYEFYLDLTISKDFNNDLYPEESVSKRLAKSVIYLPKKAIALPVNGSARMFKASKRQIKNIQKYLK
ncbi:glycosyltransferase family 4 protein [Streptococcus anginosus]|uniref:Glycosyltransferase, group 1 family protein n=1 Tax=Streptococcus anginosus subsp. whileyi CCUG 39159 TaxID=1095729 RepID=I0SI31_STRAP|nr:glycosyltransferase family 4 protein [Streptococcus anginosus]AGU83157.1 glycosyl transferase [Streptococcus anginosus C238]EID23034.1 glycosyltransferase, group 1 family protein [Streptococcus anginosus subsp. whileyi CCUG 39159]MDB8660993.1 glycosyltransferase family 4 protein [Streptococcus anginosus]MDP1384806.1 glycosyltransferase family 4 protein [Streptococcus anginosus]QQT09438.1 glycosyltransferase family 4 protein [Streptococcus anginosus]